MIKTPVTMTFQTPFPRAMPLTFHNRKHSKERRR